MPSRHCPVALACAVALLAAVAGPASATSTPAGSAATASIKMSGTTTQLGDDLDQGMGLPPAKGTSGVQQLKRTQDVRNAPQRSAAATPAAVPLAQFRASGITQRPLPVGQRPYDNGTIPIGLTDSSGVRMFRVAGDPRLYNHPVGQAHLSLAFLDSYRRSGNATYLRRAEANARRLIDRRVESRGGWYFPYDFDFAVQGDKTQTLKAPWYSGMAQGVALSAFTRLYQVTHDAAWKAAADATFATLDSGPVEKQPFASWVSATGDLWLELYPRWPVESSERVLNGQIYAAFGLYDYAQLTGSTRAKHLYDGALTTVARYLMSQFRQPRWASLYSLRHRIPTLDYHQRVVVELLYLQHQTGRPIYATWASTLRDDFPDRTSNGFGVITPATTVIYQLNADRRVVRTRAVRFARATGVPLDRRERSHGGPIMLRVSAGAYSGWWFPEAYSKARIRGAVDVHSYGPALQATFARGMKVGALRYDALNKLTGSKAMTFPRPSQAAVTKSAIVDGRLSYYLPAGIFAGYWVPAAPGLTVR